MSHEHRQSVRMPCDFPVRIALKRRFIEGVLEDVSRTGLRMRILATKLGAQSDADLMSLARVYTSNQQVFTALNDSLQLAVRDIGRVG